MEFSKCKFNLKPIKICQKFIDFRLRDDLHLCAIKIFLIYVFTPTQMLTKKESWVRAL